VDRLYSLTQASHLLGIPRRLVTGLVDAGLVAPLSGPRGQPRFGFRELVALRAAQGLADSGLPPARIARALKRLREQLPGVAPQLLAGGAALHGLEISYRSLAVGHIAVASFDLARMRRARASMGFFRDRRPDLYRPLTED